VINIVETVALRAAMWDRPRCVQVAVTESSRSSAGYGTWSAAAQLGGAGAHEQPAPRFLEEHA